MNGWRWFRILFLVLSASPGGLATAWATEPPIGFRGAFERAERSVLRVAEDHRLPRVAGHGSAVLLDRNNDVLDLVTCCHVLVGVQRPLLYLVDRNGNDQEVAVVEKVRLLPDYDLAFLQARWNGEVKRRNQLAPVKLPPAPKEGTDPLFGQWAYAGGYAFYKKALSTVDLRLGGVEDANLLIGLRRGSGPPEWKLRLVTLSPTAKGMSGGLVLAEDDTFAGIIVGRITDAVGLVLPSRLITEQRSKVGEFEKWAGGKVEWNDLPYEGKAEKLLKADRSLHAAFDRGEEVKSQNALSWRDVTRLFQYFRDPGSLREQFQEVVLEPGQLGPLRPTGAAEALSLRLHPACYADSPHDNVVVWINGKTVVTERPKNTSEDLMVPLQGHLVPGENLVILRKERRPPGLDGGKPLAVDQLLLGLAGDSVLQATLTDNARKGGYRIERALPGLVDRYSVFLTIRRPLGETRWDARLDVDINWAARVLSSHSLRWKHRLRHVASSSSIRGQITVLDQPSAGCKGPAEVRLRIPFPGPAQSLDVEMPAEFRLDEVFVNLFGVQVRETKGRAIPTTVTGRVQWVERSPELAAKGGGRSFALCARLLGGRPSGESQVPLSLGNVQLAVDVAPVVQEVTLTYINSQYLQPDQPRVVVEEQLRNFLMNAGIASDAVPAAATVMDGKLTFLFDTGGPAIAQPRAANWQAGTVLQVQADKVALGGPRVRRILNDQLPAELEKALGDSWEGISGVARLSAAKPPKPGKIEIRGQEFAPAAKAYEQLWLQQLQASPSRFYVRLPAEGVKKLVEHLMRNRASWTGLSVKGDGFVGDEELLKEAKTTTTTMSAATLQVPGQDNKPIVEVTGPTITLQPLAVERRAKGRPALIARCDVAAKELTIRAEGRVWKSSNITLTLSAELPPRDGGELAVKVESVTAQGPGAVLLTKQKGKTFVLDKSEWKVQ